MFDWLRSPLIRGKSPVVYMAAIQQVFGEVMNSVNRAVKRARSRVQLPADAAQHLRKIGPPLMLAAVLVYLLLGAAAFLSLEHATHEHEISRFYLNFGVRRRQFSREMTKALFEKNDNMLVIVDQANTQRLQDVLNKQLRDYENELPLRLPNRQAWTMTNSLNYAWGLLTTLGHGSRSPTTTGGQIFALFYCLLGVPFFMGTLLICAYSTLNLIRWLLRKQFADRKLNDWHLLAACIGVYLWFIAAFTILLYSSALPDSFWLSFCTAVLSAFTIPTAEYAEFSEPDKVITLIGTTTSLYLAFLIIVSLFGLYTKRRDHDAQPTQTTPTLEHNGATSTDGVHVVHAEHVIVDQAGSSTLSDTNRGGGSGKVREIHHY
ncbi:Potassium channel subfamily K member 5 [Aphelenchoides fujianensis]|nr:Potassium channel subfamily K member 5 [Aphelenchoides fujianensis]